MSYEERHVRWRAGDMTPESETYIHQYSRPFRNYAPGTPRYRPLQTGTTSFDSREVHIHHSVPESYLPSSRSSPSMPPVTHRHHHHRRYSTTGLFEPRYSVSSAISSASSDTSEEDNVDKMLKLVDKTRKLKDALSRDHEEESRNQMELATRQNRPRGYSAPYCPPPIFVPNFNTTKVEYEPLAPPARPPVFETRVTEVRPEEVGAYPIPVRTRPVYHGSSQLYYASTRPKRTQGRIWA